MTSSHLKVDTALRWNVGIALSLLIICPLALWQFYFKLNDAEISGEIPIEQRVTGFLKAFDKNTFDANEFFASEVLVYDSLEDVTPDQINELIAADRTENSYPRTALQTKTLTAEKDAEGNTKVLFWAKYTCYRKSLVKYVSYDIQREITFNQQNKITAMTITEVKNITTSYVMPK